MIDVITLSSKGQVVIPKKLREETGLERDDKLLVFVANGRIVIEKLDRKQAIKDMERLMKKISEGFSRAGITQSDVNSEIKKERASHRPRH